MCEIYKTGDDGEQTEKIYMPETPSIEDTIEFTPEEIAELGLLGTRIFGDRVTQVTPGSEDQA